MLGVLAIASEAIIEPMLTDAAKNQIKKLLQKTSQQQLATLTYNAVCKAQSEFDWCPNVDALGTIVALVRKSKGTIVWETWEQMVLPAVFPTATIDSQALYAWRGLIAGMLNDELKDKFLVEYVLNIHEDIAIHMTATGTEHTRQENMLNDIKQGIDELKGKSTLNLCEGEHCWEAVFFLIRSA